MSGEFENRKRNDWQTAIARCLLGCLLASGGAAMWLWLTSVVAIWLCERWNNQYEGRESESRSIVYRESGEPVLLIEHSHGSTFGISEQEFRSLDDEPIELTLAERQYPLLRTWDIGKFAKLGTSFGAANVSRRPPDAPQPLPWRMRCGLVWLNPDKYWFVVAGERPGATAYFVAYDLITNSCLGYLGTKGASPDVPPVAEQFPLWSADGRETAILSDKPSASFPPTNGNLVTLDRSGERRELGLLYLPPQRDRLYAVNLSQSSVRVLRSLEDEPLIGISTRQQQSPDRTLDERKVLRWPDRLEFLSASLETTRVVTLPAELRDVSFRLSELKVGGYVAVRDQTVVKKGEPIEQREELLWFTDRGEILKRHTMTVPYGPYPDYWYPNELSQVLTLMPASLLDLVMYDRDILDDQGQSIRPYDEPLTWTIIGRSLRTIVSRSPWPYCLCLISGLPFAIACWSRQRRFGASRFERLAWPMLVYSFGLVGWIAFLTHRCWQPRGHAVAPKTQAAAA